MSGQSIYLSFVVWTVRQKIFTGQSWQLLNTLKWTVGSRLEENCYYLLILFHIGFSAHHKPKCAVNHRWLTEHVEWSVADTERPQSPPDSQLWPDLSIASILSGSVSGVLMWAWGTGMTKLIILDDEALPAFWSRCSCVVNGSSCTTWQSSLFKVPSNSQLGVFLSAFTIQSVVNIFDLSVSCLKRYVFSNHLPLICVHISSFISANYGVSRMTEKKSHEYLYKIMTYCEVFQ